MQSRESSGSIFDEAVNGKHREKQDAPLEISSALGKSLGLVDGIRVSWDHLRGVLSTPDQRA